MSLILPRDDQHFVEVGRNGSGKTQAGLFYLSKRSFDARPWIILDTKRDALIEEIDPIEIDVSDKLPKRPGLYVARPIPKVHDAAVENFLWRIWQQEGIGVYVDEGYNIPDGSEAFTGILTQGRSKQIPLMILSQRPVWMDRFVFSEATIFNVFHIHDKRDQQTMGAFVPYNLEAAFGADPQYRLPKYWSIWHDVNENTTHILRPVPDRATILSAFRSRMVPRKRFL